MRYSTIKYRLLLLSSTSFFLFSRSFSSSPLPDIFINELPKHESNGKYLKEMGLMCSLQSTLQALIENFKELKAFAPYFQRLQKKYLGGQIYYEDNEEYNNTNSHVFRGVTNTILSAQVLTEFTKNVMKKFNKLNHSDIFKKYEEVYLEYLSSAPLGIFMEELRNYVAHIGPLPLRFAYNHSSENYDILLEEMKIKEFLCNKLKKKRGKDVRDRKRLNAALSFIGNYPNGINILKMFEQYISKVISLQNNLIAIADKKFSSP